MVRPERLGVGLVYWPSLEPLLAPEANLVDFIEIEPQAFWTEENGQGGRLGVARGVLEKFQRSPLPKLLHSVGCPVGGSIHPDAQQVDLLRRFATELKVPWVSEHLSFSRARGENGEFHALFLLPPLQTLEGVRVAVDTVRSLAARLPVPLAIETGVNYLRPRPGELPDGEFIARVASESDCGILLDLHNLYANERNGRPTVRSVLDSLPLDRVWEVHVAGGVEVDGYWLDSHSAGVPPDVMELCAELLPRLPNVRALTFEILPVFIPRMGLEAIAKQLQDLRGLWSVEKETSRGETRTALATCGGQRSKTELSPGSWERSLAELVTGRSSSDSCSTVELSCDPGVSVLRRQIEAFRSGMVAEGLTMTLRLLLLSQGDALVRKVLSEYWQDRPPCPFASTEARSFADFLRKKQLPVKYLPEVLEIELAMLRAHVEGQDTTVKLGVDPIALYRSLGEGDLPTQVAEGQFELTVRADEGESQLGAFPASGTR